MRDRDPEATLEADRKASESFLNKSTLQLESYEMYQHLLQQQASAWPCNPLNTNLEMRDSSIEGYLNQGTLQPESEMYQHTAALPRDHLIANLEVRNTDAEAKLQTDRKAKERSTRRLKRSEMGRRAQEQHKEKENEQTELFRTPTPVNKKAVGPRSARRRRVFAEANLSPDDDRARQRQVSWACSHTRTCTIWLLPMA
ncbi:hypothetical protein PVAP13_9NG362156 [Panicum virgatum]|nr:hypothetical protein PVAP13_9NG362156 [Panicum virgatum]